MVEVDRMEYMKKGNQNDLQIVDPVDMGSAGEVGSWDLILEEDLIEVDDNNAILDFLSAVYTEEYGFVTEHDMCKFHLIRYSCSY